MVDIKMIDMRIKINEYAWQPRITIWISVVYFIVATTNVLSFWKDRDSLYGQDLESGKELLTIIGIAILLITIHQLFKKKDRVILILRNSWPLVLVFLFALISCLWAHVPTLAIKRYFKVTIMALCILNLVSENDNGKSIKKALLFYTSIVLYISLFVIIFLPQYGLMNHKGYLLPRGIIAHKSEFAEFCAVTILVVLWIYSSNHFISKSMRVQLFLLSLTAFLFLFWTQGKNPLLNLILAFSFFVIFIYIGRFNSIHLILATICFFLFGAILYHFLRMCGIGEGIIEFTVKLVGKDMTFTGRTGFWPQLIYIGMRDHLLFGSGYGSFFVGEKSVWLLKYFTWDVTDAHCGYLKIFLELGIVGFSLFCFYLFYIGFSLLKINNINLKERATLLSLLIFNIFYNIISNSFLSYRISFLVIVFLTFYSAEKKAQSNLEPNNKRQGVFNENWNDNISSC